MINFTALSIEKSRTLKTGCLLNIKEKELENR